MSSALRALWEPPVDGCEGSAAVFSERNMKSRRPLTCESVSGQRRERQRASLFTPAAAGESSNPDKMLTGVTCDLDEDLLPARLPLLQASK